MLIKVQQDVMSNDTPDCSPAQRTQLITISCHHCEKQFDVVPSRQERTKYCSRACKSMSRQKQVTTTCICGVTFSAKASRNQQYCSPTCAYKAKRVVPTRRLTTQEQDLVLSYDRLIGSVANSLYQLLRPRFMKYEDFYQEGAIGLITAIFQDDEPERSDAFPGFAKVYIRYAILQAYREQEHGIRLAESLFRHDVDIPEEQIQHYRRLSQTPSLENLPEGSMYLQSTADTVERHVIRGEESDVLHSALQNLPEVQRACIVAHYGEGVAMLQLCNQYKIPRASMHRMVHRGVDALREALNGL